MVQHHLLFCSSFSLHFMIDDFLDLLFVYTLFVYRRRWWLGGLFSTSFMYICRVKAFFFDLTLLLKHPCSVELSVLISSQVFVIVSTNARLNRSVFCTVTVVILSTSRRAAHGRQSAASRPRLLFSRLDLIPALDNIVLTLDMLKALKYHVSVHERQLSLQPAKMNALA